ncbi:cobalt transporter CbiM [Rhodobacter capsulatus]|uniref:Fused nickel transport protein NikMN n=1 Tax=Rhodobacter capsulatus (strain ATCC BAA-309 / NBRC 16581 / SB1003) TaxID=272942 RepID=NIKMN_RHOCB|nr:cobalt transporter CbiM [Rhodobacter capsulatus]D5AQY8.1 RecName: Full=Fused nickel transport protein NikMN; AltName: Full=Energy-coupling factor transporter probable substrate-capture protein NikMN; Short=ECF transporter S component NikMN [Rhodobacter capsulatus SB 1003]ADE84794.1 cobalamin biosynthesis protein, CbiM family [Rhodobacter capsulatus SB 1003]ETD02261.1 nickel transporter [Rhodobacter capsulatus DE442]ETD78344.1 nickel transporter [Rhodobacter capsulatus R121]ETE54459.1 nickel
MHIPDGYLSPVTCAVTFAATVPFWYVSMRKLDRDLNGQHLPLVALVAAFSFVIMMFNLPIPGGTTAHAAGIGIAAVLLGPWAAVPAISVALLIQAIFFGDGGITAFGANCLNMAVVGPMVAAAVYALGTRGAAIGSRRRVIMAGLASYAGLNAAALLAAVEFGVQPLFFHDAAGAPLYAPYPLSVAVPAMALTHLTIAGAAEFIVTAGLVAWLQRSNPELLAPRRAPAAPERHLRLWAGIGALVVLCPLGLIAAGTAWGEWGAEDFTSEAGRAAMAGASGGVAPPAGLPGGFARLAELWSAPLPDYAPAFVQNAPLGYVLSALLGVALIVAGIGLSAGLRALTRRAG